MAQQHYYQTAPHVIAAGIALSILDVGALACRFQAQKVRGQSLKIDDWLLLPATLLTIRVGICLVYGAYHKAFGYRQYPTSMEASSNLALNQMSMSIKVCNPWTRLSDCQASSDIDPNVSYEQLEWTISILLPIAMACTKLSIVLFYRRIFSINRDLKRILSGLCVFIVLWAIAFVLATLFCYGTMLFAIWKPVSEMAMCRFFLGVLMAFCITSFVTGLVVIVVPIPIVWRLKLSMTNKLVASCSFLTGAVLIVSVGFVKEAADPNQDFILNTTLYCYWAMVECSIGVFAACLPTLQIFFRRHTWQSVATKLVSLFSGSSRRLGSERYHYIPMKSTDQREANVEDGSRGASPSLIE
ncbi:hypothetical protein PG993_011429 [Apiospora rasikravindrae]|uniref:Rhodopsin domain-containing protein n=1 Tax=Apiospora rasikravindrae TaxID=990691 RepID=A0ABR1SED3_9PEZI